MDYVKCNCVTDGEDFVERLSTQNSQDNRCAYLVLGIVGLLLLFLVYKK